MSAPWKVRFGIWLEQFAVARLFLSRYSHDYPEGKRHYVNRVSGTFMRDYR